LGAPSVGKTYELKETLIPKLNKENIKVVFIDKCESLKSLNFSENFSDKIVIIDDFYKVYMKCKEDNEIFNNLLKILKNELNSKAICISTTPYRFEWLYEKEIEKEQEKYKIFDNYEFKKFEISEEKAKEVIKENPKTKDNISDSLKKCKYNYKFNKEFFDIEDYDSYSPYLFLSRGFSDASGVLSKISEGLVKIFGQKVYEDGAGKILKKISDNEIFKTIFENQIFASLGNVAFSTIGSGVFASLLWGLLKGKDKSTISKFFSELEKASPTEIEKFEKDAIPPIPPLRLSTFKELSNPENSQKLLKLIKDVPEIRKVLEEHKEEFEKVWNEFEEIQKIIEDHEKRLTELEKAERYWEDITEISDEEFLYY
ncbi:MAG: hypothetical protein CVT89_07560, partial [Candidatus Altiarchaeales archaeon HGW-Altiarchaeales-2]